MRSGAMSDGSGTRVAAEARGTGEEWPVKRMMTRMMTARPIISHIWSCRASMPSSTPRALERQRLPADREIAVLQHLGDDVHAVLDLEVDEIRRPITHF